MRSDDKALFEHLCAEARAIIVRVRASRLALSELVEQSREALAGSRQTLLEADEALARFRSADGRLAAAPSLVGRRQGRDSGFAAIQAVEEHGPIALKASQEFALDCDHPLLDMLIGAAGGSTPKS